MNFTDSVVACDIKVDICKQLIELLQIPKVKVSF